MTPHADAYFGLLQDQQATERGQLVHQKIEENLGLADDFVQGLSDKELGLLNEHYKKLSRYHVKINAYLVCVNTFVDEIKKACRKIESFSEKIDKFCDLIERDAKEIDQLIEGYRKYREDHADSPHYPYGGVEVMRKLRLKVKKPKKQKNV